VYQLFVAEVEPADEEVQLVMQMTLEGIKAKNEIHSQHMQIESTNLIMETHIISRFMLLL
jgi:hypothetical protein